jgi:hypothetical protein
MSLPNASAEPPKSSKKTPSLVLEKLKKAGKHAFFPLPETAFFPRLEFDSNKDGHAIVALPRLENCKVPKIRRPENPVCKRPDIPVRRKRRA